GWLVSHGRRHPSQKSGNLGTCLCKSEYIIDKEQYVFPLAFSSTVTEIFRNGQSRKCHSCTCSRRLVHLSKNEGRFGVFHGRFIHFGQIPSAFFHGFHEIISIFDDPGL